MLVTVLLRQILQAVLGDGHRDTSVHEEPGQLLQRCVKDTEMRSSVSLTVFSLDIFCLAGVSFLSLGLNLFL